MRFIETRLSGAFIVEPEPRRDERGYFERVWCANELAARGLNGAFVQCNGSGSVARGTLRGLHYQRPPYMEVKLIRCIRGAVFDVVVDLRRESPSYLAWFGVELTADQRNMVYVPEGCAHGYLTLEDQSEVMYPVSQFYHPDAEQGVRWDDPRFGIIWPDGGPTIVSEKDQRWPDFTA
jgi:dTDP-4-dehydrorhamnose 3,5-epimerase